MEGGVGVLKAKLFKEKDEAKMEFPGGGGGGDAKQKFVNRFVACTLVLYCSKVVNMLIIIQCNYVNRSQLLI